MKFYEIAFIPVLIVISACGSSSDGPGIGGIAVVEGVSQISLGDLTTRVQLATANKDGDGFITASDSSLNVIGSQFINGENSDVIINLIRPIINGEAVTVVLHEDSNNNGTFELGVDLAVQSIGGGDISATSTVNVPVNTPDVRLMFTANGNTSWSITAEPQTYNWGSVGVGINPDLAISVADIRMEVVNPSVQSHPFSLIDDSTGAVELITQGTGSSTGSGSFYNNLAVNVVETGGTIQFTLIAALVSAVTKYRCDIHSTMTGLMSGE